jgi:asparagine synthase (glutamine-hydrolysing)
VGGGFPHVWLNGYEQSEVRRRRSADGHASALFVGSCLASDAELDRALPLAARGRWRSLAGPGSYLTVLRAGGETIVFGDLAGKVLVSYTVVGGGVLWSTAASALGAYVGKDPDLDQLALDMVIDGIAPYGGTAPFDGVEVVPPGWALRIVGGRYSVERWYEQRPRATFEQAAEGIGGALIDGVGRRAALCSPVSGDMGGTDSTVLLALAAVFAEVVGFTYVDDEASEDLEHSRRVAAALPRLRRRVFRRDPATDYFQGLERPAELLVPDLPSLFLLSQRHHAMAPRAARAAGSRHHLIGVGGDEVLTSDVDTLPDRLRSGRVISATRGAAALARSDRGSSARAITALVCVAAGTYERSLRAAAGAILRGAIDPESQPAAWQLLIPARATMAAGWLTRPAARRIGEQVHRLALERQPWDDPAVALDMRLRWRTSLTLAGYQQLARREGVTVHSPFTDYGVLSSSHALPSWGREPGGRFKALATAGLQQAVPPVVFARRSKDRLGVNRATRDGRQAAAPAIRGLVAESEFVAAGIFDAGAVSASVERWLTGSLRADLPILQLLAADLWLRQRPRIQWKDSQ